jgi:hypothetical protein
MRRKSQLHERVLLGFGDVDPLEADFFVLSGDGLHFLVRVRQ